MFLLDLLPTLNLQPILDAYPEDRGQFPYDPRMMTVLLLYAYSQGLTSSRQIERRCREDLAFMYLTADACPDHDTLCTFRREHLAAFTTLFLSTRRSTRGPPGTGVGHTRNRYGGGRPVRVETGLAGRDRLRRSVKQPRG